MQGPGAEFSQRAQRVTRGKVREPLGPERSGGRVLARSGPTATIGGPEGKNNRRRVRQGPTTSSAARRFRLSPSRAAYERFMFAVIRKRFE